MHTHMYGTNLYGFHSNTLNVCVCVRVCVCTCVCVCVCVYTYIHTVPYGETGELLIYNILTFNIIYLVKHNVINRRTYGTVQKR